MRLLVTGFGPFPGIPKNPSATLARRLAADLRLKRHGIDVRVEILPTVYGAADARIEASVAALMPDAVLMFGVAGKRRHLSVEIRAANRASLLHPDAAGRKPAGITLTPGGPSHRAGRAPLARLVAAGNAAGIRTKRSISAGAYLCNAGYWRMLGAAAQATPCVFLHIPKIRSRTTLLRLTDAARAAALLLIRFRQRCA